MSSLVEAGVPVTPLCCKATSCIHIERLTAIVEFERSEVARFLALMQIFGQTNAPSLALAARGANSNYGTDRSIITYSGILDNLHAFYFLAA